MCASRVEEASLVSGAQAQDGDCAVHLNGHPDMIFYTSTPPLPFAFDEVERLENDIHVTYTYSNS